MAWYSLYKWFRYWRTLPYIDMIQAYKDYRYMNWYNSLTDEERARVDANKRQRALDAMMMLKGAHMFVDKAEMDKEYRYEANSQFKREYRSRKTTRGR